MQVLDSALDYGCQSTYLIAYQGQIELRAVSQPLYHRGSTLARLN
jgi:hypothetical protein